MNRPLILKKKLCKALRHNATNFIDDSGSRVYIGDMLMRYEKNVGTVIGVENNELIVSEDREVYKLSWFYGYKILGQV